jgi:hypothetical protein
MGFPRQVNVQPAIAVEGDRASANPNLFSVVAGVGAFIAGQAGLTVGAFAWADPTYTFLNSFGAGPVTGFISREGLRADIITPGPGYPDASMTILGGSYISCFNAGDFYVRNNGSTTSVPGQKAYAYNNSGLVSFAASGSPPTSGSATGATLAKIVSASTGGALPVANTATGYINGTTLTVTAVGSGSVLAGGVGQAVSATGVVPGTSVVAQLTGTAGGIGTYSVNISQVAGTSGVPLALSLSGGGLTLTGGNTSGVFAPGMTISGTNIPTGTTILAYGTATAGGAGTYLVNQPAATAATASTVTAANAMFLTVDSSSTGTWALNDLLTGSGVGANQSIAATGATNPNLTGLGGAGTYLTNQYQASALSAQTITVDSGVETSWYAVQSQAGIGAPGELVAITKTPPG